MSSDKNLEKALDIVSQLIMSKPVGRDITQTADLYDEYSNNSDVYDLVHVILKRFNLNIYEYNYALYISPGDNNKIFGYSNEELKKELGIKTNRELYMTYFIIYVIITRFYNDSANFSYIEYIKSDEVIAAVDNSLHSVTKDIEIFSMDEVESNSFKELALVWEDLPIMNGEDISVRASRGSKAGFVKLVLNFLVGQELMLENEGKYYPKARFKAVIENYFEEYKGRLYEIMRGGNENATH